MNENEFLDWGFGEKEEKELVSVNNFSILFFLTLGLYGAWWMYKAWRYFKEKDNLDIMPVMRTIFSIFYLYGLMQRIQEFAHSKGYNQSYSSGLLFIGFVAFNLLAQLPEPMWVISILAFLFLIPPFNAFNYALMQSEGLKIREGFNQRQILLIFFGAFMWSVSIISFFTGG